MSGNTEILIKNCTIKADKALESALILINNRDIDAAFNRIYYSIFYSVLALGYKNNFISSKHRQLMGWFNKKFIHEDKIFDDKMYVIYKSAYDNRQDSDYNLILLSDKTIDEAKESLNDAAWFVRKISDYLKSVD